MGRVMRVGGGVDPASTAAAATAAAAAATAAAAALDALIAARLPKSANWSNSLTVAKPVAASGVAPHCSPASPLAGAAPVAPPLVFVSISRVTPSAAPPPPPCEESLCNDSLCNDSLCNESLHDSP